MAKRNPILRAVTWLATRVLPCLVMGITVQLYQASIRGVEPYVYEHVLQPAFWRLGLLLGVLWVSLVWYRAPSTVSNSTAHGGVKGNATIDKTLDQDGSDKQQSRFKTPKTTPRADISNPRFTSWLDPFLSSNNHRTLRMLLVVTIYICILAAALLQMYWLGVTFARVTVKALRFWKEFRTRGHPTCVYGTASLGLVGIVALDVSVLLLGAFAVVPLAICVFELFSFQSCSKTKIEEQVVLF
jgi:hypothetical protein